MSIEGQNIEELAANKDKPLVMAYIGKDDPYRGDTNGTIGIARLVTQMIGGRYVYVDWDMLDAHFPHIMRKECDGWGYNRLSEAFVELCKQIGFPDVLIGTQAERLKSELTGFNEPKIYEDSINEYITEERVNQRYLVSHHLSTDLLYEEAKNFKAHYPQIKGELCAVMMGGQIPNSDDGSTLYRTAEKLLDIGAHYDDITFFVCPSRRTQYSYASLVTVLDGLLGERHELTRKLPFNVQYENIYFKRGNIAVAGLSFSEAIENYNPYLGLLGCADHIVQVGDSGSITSEALFTGKNIYAVSAHKPDELIKKGYMSDLLLLDDDVFPTKVKLSLDNTYAVAWDMAKEFKQKAYGQLVNLPAPLNLCPRI